MALAHPLLLLAVWDLNEFCACGHSLLLLTKQLVLPRYKLASKSLELGSIGASKRTGGFCPAAICGFIVERSGTDSSSVGGASMNLTRSGSNSSLTTPVRPFRLF